MYRNTKKNTGFTLLELIVVISIAGVLVALAVPSFKDAIRNSRLTTYSNEMVTSLNLARSEAIKRGKTVTVAKVATGTCSSTNLAACWSGAGWDVFVDNSSPQNNVFDAGTDTPIRNYPPLSSTNSLSYVLDSNNNLANYVLFKPDGASNNVGSFAICDISGGNGLTATPAPYTSKLIIVNSVGRVRMGTDSNADGIPEKNSSGTTINTCITP